MRSKTVVCFFSVLLLFPALLCSVNASSDTTVTFHGGGVTIYLTYPKEAYPNTNITHYIIINSTSIATLQNFTVTIKAPVNSSWQEIFNAQDTFDKPLPTTYNLTLSLPQETNGMLQCSIFVNTTIIDDLSATLYTTLISYPTFSELQISYDEMLANYTDLQEKFEDQLDLYDSLWGNYSSLSANYTDLLSKYDALADQYSDQNETYHDLWDKYNDLSGDWGDLNDEYDDLYDDYRSTTNDLGGLQSKYASLNSTRNSLQANYTSLQTNITSLQADYDALNKAYSDLLADLNILEESKDSALNNDRIIMAVFIVAVAALITFIVYLKRKKEQPYVVIRKETVSMKPDEKT